MRPKGISPLKSRDEVREKYKVSPVSDRYQDGKDSVTPYMETIGDEK